MKDNRVPLQAHLSMFAAEAIWGLMAPVGKAAMNSGFDGISVVSFRVVGAALLLGIVFNQGLYNIGLSITSPVNASIVTTSMPIFAMVLSFFILKEPITWKKALGVAIGCGGALILILSSAHAESAKVGNIRGDLMCFGAQFSFALYLALYNPIIRKYNVFTVNKVAVDDVHDGHVAGGGLCGCLRYVCQLSAQRGGSARVAAYGGERI